MIYIILFILIQPLFVAIALLHAKLKLWAMHQELEEWISYGTGDDIFRCKKQRAEFKHYVDKEENRGNPKKVLIEIRNDLKGDLLLMIYFKLILFSLNKKLK